jgi:hypothetical protein
VFGKAGEHGLRGSKPGGGFSLGVDPQVVDEHLRIVIVFSLCTYFKRAAVCVKSRPVIVSPLAAIKTVN